MEIAAKVYSNVINRVAISIYEEGVSPDHKRLSLICSGNHGGTKSLGVSQAGDLLRVDQPELAIPFDVCSPRRTTRVASVLFR